MSLNFEKYHKPIKYLKFLENRDKIPTKYYDIGPNIIKALNAWEEFLFNVSPLPNRTLPVIWVDELREKYVLDETKMSNWQKKYILDMRKVYQINKSFIDKWFKKHKPHKWAKREKKFEWQVGKNYKKFKNSFIQLRQSGIRCKKMNYFPTMVAMVQIPIIYDALKNKYRYLTPREIGNIQSFPQNFKLSKNDYQAYKQLGNAVNPQLVYYVLKELLGNYG